MENYFRLERWTALKGQCVDYEFLDGPSLYVIELDAHWKDWGNVIYGFLVQIGPVNNGLGISITPSGKPLSTVTSQSLQILSPIVRLGNGIASTLMPSLDGRRLAIATPLGVYLYDTDTQKQVWFREFENKPGSLAFSPDGSRLAIGMAGSRLPILDTRTGQTAMELTGQEDLHGVWSPDGRYLLTSGGCEQVLVWDTRTGQIAHEVQPVKCNNVTPGNVSAFWSWDGKCIYVTNDSGNVLGYNSSTYQPLADFQPNLTPDMGYFGFVPSPAQNLLAIGNGVSITILDGVTGRTIRTLNPDETNLETPLRDIVWSPNGKYLAADTYYEQFIWDAETGKQIGIMKDYKTPSGLAWMPDGRTIVGLFSTDGKLDAANFITGKVLFGLEGFNNINTGKTLPEWDGSTLLTNDGMQVTRWEISSGQIIEQYPVSQQSPWTDASDVSPDGSRWVAWPGTIRNTASGQELVHIAVKPTTGRDVNAWSPDGTRLVSGNSIGSETTAVWDASTGKILFTLPMEAGGSPFLGALAWSPDGAWISAAGSRMNSGNNDGMIVLWDAQTGAQVHLLTVAMDSERIQSIAWSHDGHLLAAGMYSGRIVLWDMHQFVPIATLNNHVDVVFSLSWSPDDKMLASSSSDGTVIIWKIP